MSEKIKFDWDLYKSGKYEVINRNGERVKKVFKAPQEEFYDSEYPLTAFIDGNWETYRLDGCYYLDGDYSMYDIFLVKKKKVKNEEI